MNKVRYFLVVILFLIMAGYSFPTPVQAQDAVALTAGEIATGDLTSAASDVTFTFSSKKDEYIMLTFTSAGKERASGELTLLDSSGKTIAEGRGALSTTTLFAQIPADGDYTVQLKGKVSAGKDGVYAVQLIPVKVLAIGEKADVEVTSRILVDDGKQVSTGGYFLVKSDKDFSLTTLLGERQFPDKTEALVGYNITQPRESGRGMTSIFQASGSSVPGFSVMLKGSPALYLMEIDFNGFVSTGGQSKDAVLSQKFTVSAEAM